jgi:lipoate---protein ligase
MAPRRQSRPAVDAVLATRVVSVVDLYNYDELRRLNDATAIVVRPSAPALVLGSSQDESVLDASHCDVSVVRRRRGGGGVVLVAPGDLWVDWWIPVGDERWRADSRESSQLVGTWWCDALRQRLNGRLEVHHGGLEGNADHRIVCFAGRGPGEVFLDGRKVVGVTQWRVREGIFVSSIIPSRDAHAILACLSAVPEGLEGALAHHTTLSLGLDDTDVTEVLTTSGPWATSPVLPSL